jgi:hypothetical protein
MKRILKIGALAILLVAAGTLWLKGAVPFRGALTQGSRFNVSVGEPYDTGRNILLLNGYELFGSREGGLCVFKPFDTDKTVHAFAASGWPPGTVCLVEQDGRVTDIVWAFELTNGFL